MRIMARALCPGRGGLCKPRLRRDLKNGSVVAVPSIRGCAVESSTRPENQAARGEKSISAARIREGIQRVLAPASAGKRREFEYTAPVAEETALGGSVEITSLIEDQISVGECGIGTKERI